MIAGRPPPPPVQPMEVLDEYRASEEARERRSDDPDRLPRERPVSGFRGWLAMLLGFLGIAALFLLLFWLATLR